MRVLLTDLDDTLFDHQHATRSALQTLRETDSRLQQWDLESLKVRHHALLEQFHQEVLAGRMSIDEARQARFTELVGGGDPGTLATGYREAYVASYREVAGARALLDAVRARGIRVVVVTNSTVAEQTFKLSRLGLSDAVDVLLTSEQVGAQKPDPAIFAAALTAGGAEADQAVMFGDAWRNDVEGALAAGIRPVWFNRDGARCPDSRVASVVSLEPTHVVVQTLMGESSWTTR